MTADSDRAFSGILSKLGWGDLEDPDDENSDEDAPGDGDAGTEPTSDNSTDPDSSAPDGESPEDSDKPSGDLTEDDEPEVPDEAPEPEDADAPAGEPDADVADDDEETSDEDVDSDEEAADITDDTSTDEADEPSVPDMVEIDGEEVPFEEVRKGYMRQADYTRKTQELATRREQFQQAVQDQRKLVSELNSHDGMQDFLSEHPEAYEYLLARPEETRKLMHDSEELEAFKQDYEILQESPRLAEAYAKAGEEGEASERLQQERVVRQAGQFAAELDAAIETIAERDDYAEAITDDDVDSVKQRVLQMGGFDENSSPEEVLRGLNKLASVFVTPDGQNLDMSLVAERFDAIAEKRRAGQSREEKKAEDHNEEVEAELEEQKDRPPASPEGDGVAPEPETIDPKDSFHEILEDLTG